MGSCRSRAVTQGLRSLLGVGFPRICRELWLCSPKSGWILTWPFLRSWQPPTGTDTMVKSGVSTSINTKHQCITAMKEYESKSLEVSAGAHSPTSGLSGPQLLSVLINAKILMNLQCLYHTQDNFTVVK